MEKIKVLGINGSPRAKGATEYALRAALAEIERVSDRFETEYWSVRGKKISPCIHCDGCIRKKVMCVINDDLKEVEPKILEADALLVASPVYDMSITAQLAAVFHRMRPTYLVYPGKLANKVGGVITTSGTRYGGNETAKLPVIQFYLMHEMLVTGGLGGCYLGGSIWSRDQKEQGAAEDEVGMDTVLQLARGLARATIVSVEGRKVLHEYDVAESSSPLRDH